MGGGLILSSFLKYYIYNQNKTFLEVTKEV